VPGRVEAARRRFCVDRTGDLGLGGAWYDEARDLEKDVVGGLGRCEEQRLLASRLSRAECADE